MLLEVKVSLKFIYETRHKKHKEIFRQTLENKYINGEGRIISKLFLGKEIVRMAVDRTDSKL
jgi:hypothetical protein